MEKENLEEEVKKFASMQAIRLLLNLSFLLTLVTKKLINKKLLIVKKTLRQAQR